MKTFRNPIAHGADPCLTFYKGWYYLSVTTGGEVKIKKARRLAELKDAEAVTVYKSDDQDQNRDVWAPEFHRFDGKWYLYVTGGNGEEPRHRMWVAEGQGDTPMGPYVFKAKLLTDPKDEFYAIDGHPFRTKDGRMYFVWCGRPSAAGQGLYISRMANPWTLEGPAPVPRRERPRLPIRPRRAGDAPAQRQGVPRLLRLRRRHAGLPPGHDRRLRQGRPASTPRPGSSTPRPSSSATTRRASTGRATTSSSSRPTARRTGTPTTRSPRRGWTTASGTRGRSGWSGGTACPS